MPKAYQIRWSIDDSQAQAAFKRGVRGMIDVEKAALKAATAQQKALATIANLQAANAAQGVQANQQLVNAQVAGHQKIGTSAAKLLGPNGMLATFQRQRLTESQLQQAALNRAYDVAHKKRVDQILREKYATRDSFGEGIAGAFGLEGALTKAGLASAALGATVGTLQLLSDHFAKIRVDALAAAQATVLMKQSLRVEGTLLGTDDGETLLKSLSLRAATGLGASEASDLTRQFFGATPVGLQKGNVTKANLDAMLTQVGILQARQGGDAGTRGELAGLLGQFGRVDSVEAGLGQLETIRQALTEGRGDDTPLTRQLLKSAGTMVREGGAVGSLAEHAALIGVTSLTAGPEEAGTRAEQLNRALRTGLTRKGKGKGALEPQGDYLKNLGVTEKSSLERALDLIVPDLQKQIEAGRDPEVYLAEHGFRNYEERRALVETSTNYGPLKQRLAAARKGASGADVLAANREYLQSGLGQNQVADQLGDVRSAIKGTRYERLRALETAAATSKDVQAGDESFLQSTVGDYLSGVLMGQNPFPVLGFPGTPTATGRRRRVTDTAIADLVSRAKGAGVTEDELRGARYESYRAGDLNHFEAEFVNRAEGLIRAHGGSTAVDASKDIKELTNVLRETNRLLNQSVRSTPRTTPPALPLGRLPDGPGR